MSDYSELKRLAEAATNARWHEDDLGDALEFAPLDGEDQAFILAASPAAVFELIAENERLSGECEGCPMAIAEELRKERDALRSALAEAKYRIEQGRVWAGTKWQLTGLHPHGQQKALDVIDAAMSQGEQA